VNYRNKTGPNQKLEERKRGRKKKKKTLAKTRITRKLTGFANIFEFKRLKEKLIQTSEK
jgi:hypothetical protein